jgi:hypothetical protein
VAGEGRVPDTGCAHSPVASTVQQSMDRQHSCDSVDVLLGDAPRVADEDNASDLARLRSALLPGVTSGSNVSKSAATQSNGSKHSNRPTSAKRKGSANAVAALRAVLVEQGISAASDTAAASAGEANAGADAPVVAQPARAVQADEVGDPWAFSAHDASPVSPAANPCNDGAQSSMPTEQNSTAHEQVRGQQLAMKDQAQVHSARVGMENTEASSPAENVTTQNREQASDQPARPRISQSNLSGSAQQADVSRDDAAACSSLLQAPANAARAAVQHELTSASQTSTIAAAKEAVRELDQHMAVLSAAAAAQSHRASAPAGARKEQMHRCVTRL